MNTYSFRKDLISVQEELLRFAYKLTADKEEANDLLQETSLKALDNEDKYMPDTNFKGWMYTIMRNIFNPLAELNKRIFKSANRFVVNVVYILKDCKCTYFP